MHFTIQLFLHVRHAALVAIFCTCVTQALAQGSIMRVAGTGCVGSENVFVFPRSGCSATWSVGGGGTIIAQDPNTLRVKWNSPTTNAYVSISYSCSSAPTTGSIYFPTFTVSNPLTPTVTIAANQNGVCAGTSVTFTATPTNGGTMPSYSWKVNGTVVASNGTTFTRSNLVNGDVVTATMLSNVTSCLSQSTATSNAITMNMLAPVTTTVSVAGAAAMPWCNGIGAFTATAVNGGSNPTYTWYKNGSVAADRLSNTAPNIYAIAGSFNANDKVKCVMTSNHSCVSGSPATSNELTVAATTPITPLISIAPSQTSFCAGSNVTFSASSGNSGYTVQSYAWKLNGNAVGTNASTYSTTQFAPGSIVTVTTTYSGCVAITSSTASTSAIPFTVKPVPAASILPAGSVKILSTATQTINATPTGAGYSFRWKKNGTVIGGATAAVYGANAAGSYTADVTLNGCTGTSAPLVLALNMRPNISAGSDKTLVLPTTQATITGTASDPDGTIATYSWTKVSGGEVDMAGINTATLTITNAQPGAYVFNLKATDNMGEYSNDNVAVTVTYPPNNYNQVRETVVLVPNKRTDADVDALSSGQKLETWSYFDGFGRAIQVVNRQASGKLQADLVQPMAYDELGRESKKYLPYVDTTATNGYYKENALRLPTSTGTNQAQYQTGQQYAFYQTAKVVAIEPKPYAETLYEPSLMNRPLKQGAPGSAWQPNTSAYATPTDHTVAFAYEHNVASEVVKWTYTYPQAGQPLGMIDGGTAAAPVFYPANTLYKARVKDEDGKETIEYIDNDGRVVLKRVQAVAGSPATTGASKDSNWAGTYYVYDDFGNVVCVLPPEATERLATAFYQAGATTATKDAFLNVWAFRYTYDEKKRMNQKRVPGAETIYMVYDVRDRLAVTQDGNQRNVTPAKEWSFIKYDMLNRVIMNGRLNSNNDLPAMQAEVNAYYAGMTAAKNYFDYYVGSATGNVLGYDNKSYPVITAAQCHSVTYYDVYDAFIAPAGYVYVNESLSGQPVTESKMNGKLYGQVTGQMVKNLATGTWLRSVSYYDERLQAVQTYADHHKGTTPVRTTNIFDFAGRRTTGKRTYLVNGVTTAIKETQAYDNAGRPTTLKHSMNGRADVMIVKNEYNELGQLADKMLHSTDNGDSFKQSVDFRYNIRGWLAKINEADIGAISPDDDSEDYFGMELQYDGTLGGLPTTPAYNGNISAMRWSKGNGGHVERKAYAFTYDALSRLKSANHYDYEFNVSTRNWQWNSNNNGFGELLTYDLNGNIETLQRRGFKGASLDNLTYGYSGNQLNYVNDAHDASKGFVNGNTGTDDYSYDFNGNLDKDKNKGLSVKGNIKYNFMNLPTEVIKGTEKVKYIYNAAGVKLAQEVYNTSGMLTKVTDYIGELVYEGPTQAAPALQFVQHAEGRALPDGSAWEYQYHLKDHLGSVRVTFTAKPQVAVTKSANFETATNPDFLNYGNIQTFDLVDHTDAATVYQKVQTLNGGASGRVGLAKSIAVMPGDQITISAYGKYMNLGTVANNTPLIDALAAAFGVSSSSTGEQRKIYNGLNSFAGTVPAGNHIDDSESEPKAFVTILFFDKEYNLLDAAWDQVTPVGKQTSPTVKQPHDLLSVTAKAPEGGYAYVFVSNEHPYFVDFYFDDVSVAHTPSPIVSSSDYYPFGLAFNAYSRENSTPNQYQYNGKELMDELSLSVYDFGWRNYDPTINRWMTLDPMAAKYLDYSPYCFTVNSPIKFIDPNGLDVIETPFSTIYNGEDAKKFFRSIQAKEASKPMYHHVKKGESFASIAKSYGVTTTDLFMWNANSVSEIENFYNKRQPEVDDLLIISEAGYQDYLIRNIAGQIAEKAGTSPNDPILLEMIRNRYGYNEVDSYYNSVYLGAPPNLGGGDSEIIGTAVEAVANKEGKKYLLRKGVPQGIVSKVPWISGPLMFAIMAVFDPSSVGDGTMVGEIRKANSSKVERINKALNER